MSCEPERRAVAYLLDGAFHRLSYLAWGDPAAPVLVCVHGLTRNAHDFDALAAALSDRHRVLCPDLPGHGESSWLPDPARYDTRTNGLALAHLLAAIGRPVAFLGTSQGGMCGMMLAAAKGTPVNALILNDIGPFLPAAGLTDIAHALAMPGHFPDASAFATALHRALAGFGPIGPADWNRVVAASQRKLPDGGIAPAHDPALAAALAALAQARDQDRWWLWDGIAAPCLAIRGEHSTLLTPATLETLAARGAATHTVAGAGHAPWLADTGSQAAIRAFLG